MKNIFLIFLLCVTSISEAQQLSDSTEAIVKQIEKYDELTYETVGFSMTSSPQYRDYLKLSKTASVTELLSLLKHRNPIVKGYASWALIEQRYNRLDNVLAVLLNSPETVNTHIGCLVGEDNLADVFYSRVRYPEESTKRPKSDSKYYLSQIKKLDSLIIHSGKRTHLFDYALQNNAANPSTYKIIRDLAFIHKDTMAMVALAEYKNDADIDNFIAEKERSFLSISHFPNERFWSFLYDQRLTSKAFTYFLAVASFKNTAARNLFEQQLSSYSPKELEDLQEALTKHYCELYQDLIISIWERIKTIDYTATKILVTEIPENASIAFANGLSKGGPYGFMTYDDNYGSADSILPLMLETVKKYNKETLFQICESNIISSKMRELAIFLDCIETSNYQQAKNIIFQRLRMDNYPLEYFHLSKTLLSFKNVESNVKLVEILNSKRDEWDRGNWSEHFRELFHNYKVKLEK